MPYEAQLLSTDLNFFGIFYAGNINTWNVKGINQVNTLLHFMTIEFYRQNSNIEQLLYLPQIFAINQQELISHIFYTFLNNL